MKTTSLYDFTLTANGTQVILADANFYKVLTATGDIQVTRDGGATIKPMRAGRGERNVPFQRLILKDISGAPNSGTILVGDSDFIDDTIVISSAINVRPEATTGTYKSSAATVANTPETVFLAGANTGGVIVSALQFIAANGGSVNPGGAFVAKATAPTSPTDGEVILSASYINTLSGTSYYEGGALTQPQYIAAGLGLYYISANSSASGYLRSGRWKAL